jgi:hypothetical protein
MCYTKGLPSTRFVELKAKLMVRPPPMRLRGGVSDVSTVQFKQSEDIEDPVNEEDKDTTSCLAKVSSDTLLPKYNEQLQQSNS